MMMNVCVLVLGVSVLCFDRSQKEEYCVYLGVLVMMVTMVGEEQLVDGSDLSSL